MLEGCNEELESSLQPSHLQAEQPLLSQPVLVREVYQIVVLRTSEENEVNTILFLE